MNYIKSIAITAAIIIASSTAYAAKPVNINYIADIVAPNDLVFSHYKVTCSDGRTADISAWNNRNKWCVGRGKQNNCSKKQINIAKKVCK